MKKNKSKQEVTGRVSVGARPLIVINFPSITFDSSSKYWATKVKLFLEKVIHRFGVAVLTSQH